MTILPNSFYKDPKKIWTTIKHIKKTNNLLFIHTPKCAGSYVKTILKDLNIDGHEGGHRKPKKKDPRIVFTVFRHPVDRFYSLINYRLQEKSPRKDWPTNLEYIFLEKKNNIDINNIVKKMTDQQILSFKPFRTLNYWSKNVNIFIKINQLNNFLNFFGFNYDPYKYKAQNVSKKLGTFDLQTVDRIKRVFNKDILLYNKLFPE